MRILADENVPGPVIRALRDGGHDVVAVKETMRGVSDRVILERANAESRLVVTFDKDFGELAVRLRLAAPGGVVLLRLTGTNPDVDNARAVARAYQSRRLERPFRGRDGYPHPHPRSPAIACSLPYAALVPIPVRSREEPGRPDATAR